MTPPFPAATAAAPTKQQKKYDGQQQDISHVPRRPDVVLKVEETPLLAVRFTPRATNDLVRLVKQRLREEGIIVLSQTEQYETTTDNNNHDNRNDNNRKEPKTKMVQEEETTETDQDNEKNVRNQNEQRRQRHVVLVLTSSEQALEEAAEEIRLIKRTKDGVMEHFTSARRTMFQQNKDSYSDDDNIDHNDDGNDDDDDDDDQSPRTNHRRNMIFTSAELVLLADYIVTHILVKEAIEEDDNDQDDNNSNNKDIDTANTKDGSKSHTLSQYLRKNYNVDCHRHDIEMNRSLRDYKDDEERERLIQFQQQSDSMTHILIQNNLIDRIIPIHGPYDRERIFYETCHIHHPQIARNTTTTTRIHGHKTQKSPWFSLFGVLGLVRDKFGILDYTPPIHDIQQYYGWEVAYYYAFMGFVTEWLCFPAFIGIGFFSLRWYRNDTIDDDEYTPFYGLITFIWSVLLLRFWERQENRLAYQWGTYSFTSYARQKSDSVRPNFVGELRISPITGRPEVYYDPSKRKLKYVVSSLVTIAMLAVAFIVMILSLNLQGYIRPKSNPSRWNESSPHPFHFASFAALAEEGRIFDYSSSWKPFMPVIIHVVCITSMNLTYRHVAERLTEWENHQDELSHHNSLVLKRFLFEAFDCYVALFYLAFYERDVDKLNAELVAVFQIVSIRRVLMESVIPIVMNKILSRGKKRSAVEAGSIEFLRRDDSIPTRDDILNELDLDKYEDFDDYMEMIIQIGYVTLFASAYPLASLVSIAVNWVVIRNDIVELSRVCQRPLPKRVSNIGMWKTLTSIVIWTSALTNCLLAGFTSNQLMDYMPGFYIQDRHGFTTLAQDKGWLVIFVIFGLEHVLIVIGLLLFTLVPPVPSDVRNELEKRYHDELQRRMRRRSSSARTMNRNIKFE